MTTRVPGWNHDHYQ